MRRTQTLLGVSLTAAWLLGAATPAGAQSIEIAPFGGVRFGSGLFEAASGRPVDTDASPAVGLVVDIPLSGGLQVEAAFSHQRATGYLPGQPFTPATQVRFVVDHYQVGGLQEYGVSRARPFLTGVLGLTRYGGDDGDDEIRFTAGAGGGIKLFPVSHLGIRLDGRVFATLVDAEGTALVCANQTCFVGLNVNVAWQAEFTAGLVVRLR